MQGQYHQQGLNQAQSVTLDLLQVDDSINKINDLDITSMEHILQLPKHRHSFRQSGELDLTQLINGQQLDNLIDKLLQILTNTKIQLLQLDDPSLIKVTEKTKSFTESFYQEIKQYNKTLLLRESQIGSLIFVLQKRHNPDFRQKYLTTYKQIADFIIPYKETQKPINTVILQQAFQTQIQFLKQYSDMMTLVKLNIVHKKYMNDLQSLIRHASRLKIINSKIITIAEVFPYACVLDKNDLFSFKKSSQRWSNLLQNSIKHKIYGQKQKIKNTFTNLRNGINLVNASMSILHQTRQGWVGNVHGFAKNISSLATSTSKILKCLIFKQHASHEAQMLISNPDGALAKQIWNLPEQKMVKSLSSLVLPSIAFSQQFYIPRKFNYFLEKDGKVPLPELYIYDKQIYLKQLYNQNNSYPFKIPMRINSPYVITQRIGQNEDMLKSKNVFSLIVKSFQHANKQQIHPKQVIFHIHGGGFISMSSFIHQSYTRVWANNLKVPIISVDYGKAPENPFPSGLYDCFQAYMWTLECYQQVFNASPAKIILVGDSAGGNLVSALTNMIIQLNLRVPDGIVLVYPALNLNYKNYTPSLLTSLNDTILPHTFLKICLKAYLKQDTDALNQYVSPIYAKDQVLKKYPKTRIFVGNKDPFHDDCCRLTEKINKFDSEKAKLLIFDQFPHGFLQFDLKTQPHQQSRKATKEVEMALAELLWANI